MAGSRDQLTSQAQSVERAFAVLASFTDERPRWRVTDLAERLGLPQSTVSRLLSTMEQIGFVQQDQQTGFYSLGLAVVTLAGVALNQLPVQREAMLELSAAAAELGLAANLAIPRGDEIFYLVTKEGPKAPKHFTMIGKRNPLHCTAMGKVLLAHLPETAREAVLARIPYPRFTANTLASADELRPVLETIVARGYASEREELALGRACLAAPVRDASGAVVAAVSISGPLSVLDLDQREASLAGHVIEMADRISSKLGYVTVPMAMMASGSTR